MRRITAAPWWAHSVLLMVLAGCADGGGIQPTLTTRSPAPGHDPTKLGWVGKVLLVDSTGSIITRTSTTPYHPRQTCGRGGCHLSRWSAITNAYHFSQGRTKADGTILISDNYSAKPWMMSDGMYGKW